jgi:hypothetical protein
MREDLMPGPDPRGIYFDSAHLGEPEYSYVCWLDVMGAANQMVRSLPIAANFIFKLHCAVIEAFDELGSERSVVSLYPIMDGVYITSKRRGPLQDLVNQALCRVATTFLREEKCFHQFLVRGAVTYGPVYRGAVLDPRTTRVLEQHDRIRDEILLGLPVAQAYQAERDAPPFGVAAHSSARAFAPEGDLPFRFVWLDWFRHCRPAIDPQQMLRSLEQYFAWQRDHCNMTGYEPARIEMHAKLAKEYFTASESPDRRERP